MRRDNEEHESLGRLLVQTDLSQLTEEERVALYLRVCESTGLNPYTKPFAYVDFERWDKAAGRAYKVTNLYATRNATDQLRQVHDVSVRFTGRQWTDDLYIVTAQAALPGGRVDEATGVVALGGLKGVRLANALMTAETKAKRRVTLSICGLSMLDETEVADVPGAVAFQASGPAEPSAPAEPQAPEAGRRKPPKPQTQEEMLAAWERYRENLLRDGESLRRFAEHAYHPLGFRADDSPFPEEVNALLRELEVAALQQTAEMVEEVEEQPEEPPAAAQPADPSTPTSGTPEEVVERTVEDAINDWSQNAPEGEAAA